LKETKNTFKSQVSEIVEKINEEKKEEVNKVREISKIISTE
jgi:hypothetical protein